MANPTSDDKVRELQRTLYRAAKAAPGRRFHALYDKVYRRDVLQRAWEGVRENRGSAGVDGVTLAQIAREGSEALLLDELAADLRAKRYRPGPARRVWIDKPGTGEKRPLSIPTVRDRVVQAALKIVLEPLFEADFLGCSYGFRPKRGAHDALQVLIEEAWHGRRWVVETDIASCFESIPQDRLLRAVEGRVCDQSVLKLLRVILRAGVMEDGSVRHPASGTPQGGVISPLLANIYLHQVDVAWTQFGRGVLVRYADDLVVMCRTRQEAEASLVALRRIVDGLGLQLKEPKTRIVHLREGGEGIDFLGFHHRWVRARRRGVRHITFLARWPSRKAMQHARDRIREMTRSEALRAGLGAVVERLNRFLRGWVGYFRYGVSAHAISRIRAFAADRLARLLARKHGRRPSWGRAVLFYNTRDQLGLLDLRGVVIPPRPHAPWRVGAVGLR
jgi:group II intron reverse transcriptase/maturase